MSLSIGRPLQGARGRAKPCVCRSLSRSLTRSQSVGQSVASQAAPSGGGRPRPTPGSAAGHALLPLHHRGTKLHQKDSLGAGLVLGRHIVSSHPAGRQAASQPGTAGTCAPSAAAARAVAGSWLLGRAHSRPPPNHPASQPVTHPPAHHTHSTCPGTTARTWRGSLRPPARRAPRRPQRRRG